MDKGAIKTFAIEARKILMKSAATQAGFYGVTKDGCTNPIQKGAGFEVYRTIAGTENRIYGNDINRRRKLKEAVESQGFDQVIEETAYTWFNRLIAIRFMEVNGYLPTRTRVLSSETGSNTPDLVAQYMDVDLGMSDEEIEKVADSIKDNRYDDAFALLFIKQCNALNELLPKLFEKTDDYMELLLKLSYTSDGVVRMLVDTIPESNFNVEEEGQVEIIGWLYQYYNTEPKNAAFAKKGKVAKEEIPAVTQLFTPDWIVRYMVENSLGRLWNEGHPQDELKQYWKHYIDDAEQEVSIKLKLAKIYEKYADISPEDISIIDPCMGSGHILVYAFDVLMQIYEAQGFATRDIPQMILENNLYGLDIDKRAMQMAYFAIMMKACQYNKRFLRKAIQPKLHSIDDSCGIIRHHLDYFGASMSDEMRKKAHAQLSDLLEQFADAKEFGSIMEIADYDWPLLDAYVSDAIIEGQLTFDTMGVDNTIQKVRSIIDTAKILARKFDVVITNPPYMGSGNMDGKLLGYVKKNFPDSKSDLFSVFIERCYKMLKENGLQAMITQHSWMFLSSYEKLRLSLKKATFVSMLHLGAHAFEEISGEVVQTTSFVIRRNAEPNYKGTYNRLVHGTSSREKEEMFFEGTHTYYASQNSYDLIPGSPVAYWLSASEKKSFEYPKLSDVGMTRRGLQTGNKDKFIRFWYEPSIIKCQLPSKPLPKYKWVIMNNGGNARKWYGEIMHAVNWADDGAEIKASGNAIIPSEELYFKECITWNRISVGSLSVKYQEPGIIQGDMSPFYITNDKSNLKFAMGFMNSCVAKQLINIINPTITMPVGDIAKLPIYIHKKEQVETIVTKLIDLAKEDWDSFEVSWDYATHPLIRYRDDEENCTIEAAFSRWEEVAESRFNQVKELEEALNSIFISIYGLEAQLNPNVEEKNITVRKADLQREVKSLLSYFVGCIFGRYSLDQNGIIYAGGKWDISSYIRFKPDKDNCIPISDEQYFEDDIVGQLCTFLKSVYGEKTLDQNLSYIARALGNKGNSSLEIIRNYFISDFFKDHCAVYSVTGSGRRPIYWLFDSGKQNGFKCLIYMHRYDKDTVGRVRSDYLRKVQDAIEGALKNAEYTIANSTSAVDKAAATKKREKYIKQLNETRTYFQALSHVALQRIEIDLDDGVKTNYAKFQGIEIVDENGKKQKIDLLAKI